MNTNLLILLSIVLVIGAIIGATFFAFIAMKKKWNVPGVLATADASLNEAGSAVSMLKPFIPLSFSSIAEKIIDWAKSGVSAAEQLYQIGTITGDQRKTEATDFIKKALAVEGINITPDLDILIDKSIEAAVRWCDYSSKKQKVLATPPDAEETSDTACSDVGSDAPVLPKQNDAGSDASDSIPG